MIPTVFDPIVLFREWFEEARACDAIREPTAMTVATVDEHGTPWVRVVLLKDASARGFAFYTNARSRKGRQLACNPRAALCFYWMPLDRQVRVRGSVERISGEEADRYFATRPRESQLSAWASDQSEVLESRGDLERRFAEVSKEYEGRDVPRPPYWGGYVVVPDAIEFWLKQPHRLHDRVLYSREGEGWRTERLYP